MYQIGDVVRPSDSFLKNQKKRSGVPLTANHLGTVTGYKAPVRVNGEHVGVVWVRWPMEGAGLLYQVRPMRWDQITR